MEGTGSVLGSSVGVWDGLGNGGPGFWGTGSNLSDAGNGRNQESCLFSDNRAFKNRAAREAHGFGRGFLPERDTWRSACSCSNGAWSSFGLLRPLHMHAKPHGLM